MRTIKVIFLFINGLENEVVKLVQFSCNQHIGKERQEHKYSGFRRDSRKQAFKKILLCGNTARRGLEFFQNHAFGEHFRKNNRFFVFSGVEYV